MIGNDLVYIPGWAKSGSKRHQRLKDKLFLASEQQLVKELPDFGESLLWSMKEATYKVVFRKETSYRYAPKSLSTSIHEISENRIEGRVKYNNADFYTESWIAENYIHTIALPSERKALFDQVKILVASRKRNQSDYKLVISDTEVLEIVKDELGIPRFKGIWQRQDSCVSISHDNDRIAYAWLRGYTNE